MSDRKGLVTFKGNPLTLAGEAAVEQGQSAPDFTVSKSLVDDIKLSDFRGKTVILNVVPSLDTPVCSVQTARFNQEAKGLGDKCIVLTLSNDLPVAQARWCQANVATNIQTASDYKHHDFATKFGLLVKELGLLARSVFVIDGNGKVTYKQLVTEVSSEPDYAPAIEAAKKS